MGYESPIFLLIYFLVLHESCWPCFLKKLSNISAGGCSNLCPLTSPGSSSSQSEWKVCTEEMGLERLVWSTSIGKDEFRALGWMRSPRRTERRGIRNSQGHGEASVGAENGRVHKEASARGRTGSTVSGSQGQGTSWRLFAPQRQWCGVHLAVTSKGIHRAEQNTGRRGMSSAVKKRWTGGISNFPWEVQWLYPFNNRYLVLWAQSSLWTGPRAQRCAGIAPWLLSATLWQGTISIPIWQWKSRGCRRLRQLAQAHTLTSGGTRPRGEPLPLGSPISSLLPEEARVGIIMCRRWWNWAALENSLLLFRMCQCLFCCVYSFRQPGVFVTHKHPGYWVKGGESWWVLGWRPYSGIISLMVGSPATSTEVERKDLGVEMGKKVTVILWAWSGDLNLLRKIQGRIFH